jgi:hypothetical protein
MTCGPHPGRRDRVEPLANPARVYDKGDVMRTLRLSLAGTVIVVLLGIPGSVVAAEEEAVPTIDGQAIAEMAIEAVASCGSAGCDEGVVEAVYALDSRLIVDGQVFAEGLEEVKDGFVAANRTDHAYRLLTPVAQYQASDGDLYVAQFVEVVSPGHPTGDPIISLMQVRDGKVIRQFDMTPPFKWAAESTD